MTTPASPEARSALNHWLQGHAAGWSQLGAQLDGLQGSGKLSVPEVVNAANAYRRVGRDLSLARLLNAPASTTRYLTMLYAGLHQALTRPASRPLRDLRTTFKRDVPASFAALRGRIFWIAVLFFGVALAGWSLVRSYPDLVGLVASREMIEGVEQGRLWTDGLLNIVPSAALSARIFTNNIVVALTACCIGALYGLGTIYLVSVNGFMLGAMFAFTGQHGMAGRLFEFIVAHGPVELFAVFVSGAVGVSLGEALIRPGQLSRRRAFEAAARNSASIMLVCIAFLVGAGLIEGYVSPEPMFPLPARIVIGVCYLTLFLIVLTGAAARPAAITRGAPRGP